MTMAITFSKITLVRARELHSIGKISLSSSSQNLKLSDGKNKVRE